MTIPVCCITGRIAGDSAACGDCDPCGAARSVPEVVRKLLAEKDEWAGRYSDALCSRDELQAANAKLREVLGVAYDAMSAALHKCQIDVRDFASEHPEVRAKRLAIFSDLDIPLARVGCVTRASDEALAEIDARVREALSSVEQGGQRKP